MKARTVALAVTLLAFPAAADVPKPPAQVQEGNACLPTAAAMALHALGTPTVARDITRRMPVYTDGTDFFDLQEELARRGFDTLVFTGGAAHAAAALNAELPVVAAVKRGATKHAVLVWGTSIADDAPRLHVLDPADGAERVLVHEEFEAMQFARQLLIVWPGEAPVKERLNAVGFPLAEARAVNARFRASALLRRADRHTATNSQAVELLERASREDPTWEEPRRRLEAARRTIGGDDAPSRP